ncbi:MAG: glycosyl hydrolase family 65 protein [Candidatus Omnitrophica bacterium]|nr:glycosyl hydrolase family 65 protein [Candidatus Omnitrophota bacterium]MDD5553125.1 glycosyl hydrolase family 65 protein [Candidatus Omnitrophota bacterium]
MKDFYAQYKTDEFWLAREKYWEPGLQNTYESQFTLSNGYFGSRGVLEEIPHDASPGTYIAGIYDKIGSQVAELANLPNPVNFKFIAKGEKIDVAAMDVLRHRRILNLKKGLLIRNTLYQDAQKRRYDYQSLRFVSMHNKNIGAMQIMITPQDAPCTLDVITQIDTSVSNSGILSEGRKQHFCVREVGRSRSDEAAYLVVDICHGRYCVIFWAGFWYKTDGRKIFSKENVFRLKLEKNQTAVFTKIFYLKHFPKQPDQDYSECKKETFREFSLALRAGFSSLTNSHIEAWEKLWKRADILIRGTGNLQTKVRFNIYHMLACCHTDSGFSSLGARTLSGEGYRGHIFWDAEIFLLPFYMFTFPEAARNMLLYRCNRIEKARELARKEGYRGAKFPWESADSGEEETPEWARDIDRTIVRIHTHTFEHHITSDIAYAIYRYSAATRDKGFMRQCGYEILFESARFWASRVKYDKGKKKYVIRHVIGPDEFHIEVHNNAYTNIMAKWNLSMGHEMFSRLKGSPRLFREITGKISLEETEAREWKETASKMAMNINKERVIEQFDGFFKLKKIIPKSTDEHGMPLLPPGLKAKDLGKTQLVKQPDVLMVFCLLDEFFSLKTKRANYDFYLPRTVHKSSLSPSIHSLLACQLGDLQKAYSLFNVALRVDLSNLFGNTPEGVHAASLGGTWQALVFGFAGVWIRKGELSINPRFPLTWKNVVFSLRWRDDTVRLDMTNESIRVKIVSGHRGEVPIWIFDAMEKLKTNKLYVFKRKAALRKEEGYYY